MIHFSKIKMHICQFKAFIQAFISKSWSFRCVQTFLALLGVLQNRSLEDSLRETEGRYAHEVNGFNSGILQLEGELGQVRAQLERQAAEYENLLSLKTKLEAEIATYHRLLEGVVDDDKGDKNR